MMDVHVVMVVYGRNNGSKDLIVKINKYIINY